MRELVREILRFATVGAGATLVHLIVAWIANRAGGVPPYAANACGFVAAFSRSGSGKAIFYAAYIVRAVTPGRYVLPPATIEDMYRPDRFGRTAYGTIVIGKP